MHFKKLLLLGAISGATLATRADVRLSIGIGLPGIVVVREAPPAPRYEDRGPPPSPDFFWVEGRWSRDHDHWVWIRGHWDHRPRPEAVWVPGHWDRRDDGWVWIDGRWEDRHHDHDYAQPPPPPPPVQEVYVQDRPPPEYVDEVPPPPGPDFFWVRGHWVWRDRWVWFHGHYEHQRHDRDWHEGRYEHRPEGWIWIEGRWR